MLRRHGLNIAHEVKFPERFYVLRYTRPVWIDTEGFLRGFSIIIVFYRNEPFEPLNILDKPLGR